MFQVDDMAEAGGSRITAYGSRMSRAGRILIRSMLVPLGIQAASAADRAAIAGDYVCTALCRPSDAPPGIEVVGDVARCMSELGGVYVGRTLSGTAVACFGKTGTLAADGMTLRWSDGVVWKRRSPP